MDKALTTVINIISFCGSIIEFADKPVLQILYRNHLLYVFYMTDEVWHSTKNESDKHIFDK